MENKQPPSELDEVKAEIRVVKKKLEAVEASLRAKNKDIKDHEIVENAGVLSLRQELHDLRQERDRLLAPSSSTAPAPQTVFDMSKLEKKLEEVVERAVKPVREDNQAMRMELHTAVSRIPELTRTDVTPSQASQDELKYRNTHEALSLGTVDKKRKLTGPSSVENLRWTWSDDAKESDSYETVCDYIEADPSYRAINVSAGQLYGKDLFKREVYTLRSKVGAHGEDLTYQTTIHGRTDILVFHQSNYEEPLPNTRLASYAIEIKTAKEMSRMGNHNDREAEMQLLGLNIGNSNRHASPPVLLTNLVGTNDVFYVERTTDVPLKYTIICQPCSTFAKAIEFIKTELLDPTMGYRKSVTKDLGRAPTPPDTSNSEVE